jgi:hypothetical protein
MAQGDDHGPVNLIAVCHLPQFKRETLQVASLNPTSQIPDSEDTPTRYRNDRQLQDLEHQMSKS